MFFGLRPEQIIIIIISDEGNKIPNRSKARRPVVSENCDEKRRENNETFLWKTPKDTFYGPILENGEIY